MGTSTVIKTEALGQLSWTKFNKLVKSSGSQAEVARSVGVSPSTVRNWGMKLRNLRSANTAG